MYAFKLKEVVRKKAEEKEIKMYDSHEDLLDEIEKGIKAGEINDMESLRSALKKHEDFRLKFGLQDYEDIAEELR